MPRPHPAQSPGITSALVIPICFAMLLSLPAILSGYLIDDLVFTSPIYRPDSPFQYYDFIEQSQARNLLPWWHAEDIHVEFFRPLSSALLAMEFTLGDHTPLFSHLITAAFFLFLLVGLYLVLIVFPIPRGYIKWVMLAFATAGYHAIAIGFISSRHAPMANTFAIWALAFHVRQSGHPYAYSALSLGLYLLALLSGESAVAFPLFALGCDLIWRTGNIKQRLAPTMPAVGITILYLLAYAVLGFGAQGVGAYLNPLSSPVRFILNAPEKTLAMMGSFAFGIPAQLRLNEAMRTIPIVAGLSALVIIGLSVALAFRNVSTGDKRIMKGAALGGFLALLPGLSGMSTGRAFAFAGLGFSIFIISLLVTLFLQPHPSLFRRIAMRGMAAVLTIGLFGISPLVRIATSHFIINQGSVLNEKLAKSPLPCKPGANVYLLNGEFMTVYFAPYAVANTDPPLFNRWYELVSINDDITVKRIGERLTIARKGASLIEPFVFDLFADAQSALPRGATIVRDGLSAKILDRAAGGPSLIEFTIPELASRDKVCLLKLDNYQLKRFELPKDGESYTLAYTTPLI